VIATPRLVLRPVQDADLDFVASLLAHPEVMRFYPKPYTRGEAAEWIRLQVRRYGEHGFGYWIAEGKAESGPVGVAGLVPVRLEGDAAEGPALAYMIHRPHWGRGYATEASAACRDWAFTKLGIPSVRTLIRPENEASIRVARKLGLRRRTTLMAYDLEHAVFEMLRADHVPERWGTA
jgi:RimJ/RimL family protein N-acetyltransferase